MRYTAPGGTIMTYKLGFDKLRYYVYDGLGPLTAPPCLYCGLPSRDREHVVPRSFLEHLLDLGIVRDEILVPSCRECNRLASNQIFDTYVNKYEYIQRRLRDRYRKVLEMPEWTTSEIMSLEGNLRRRIRSQLRLKHQLLERLAWDPAHVLTAKEHSKLLALGTASVAMVAGTTSTSIAVTGL